MERIVPNLWYDKEAKEAATFYVSVFDDSKILDVTVIEGTPSGDAEMVSFQLEGQLFSAISGGPFFTINPSVSMMVDCATPEEVDEKYRVLSQGGVDLMPLGEYGFSKRYAWVQDRFGLSWQLMVPQESSPARDLDAEDESARYGVDQREIHQKITPCLLFSGAASGMAEEAMLHYTSVFKGGRINLVSHYKEGEALLPAARINFASFTLNDMNFAAMDNGYPADFGFNEGVSLMIYCNTQAQIDYYWDALSADPKAEQCGWLKDRYGVSWQVTPAILDDIMYHGTREEARRVTQAFLPMKKIDLKKIKEALRGDRK